ncbi:MAG: AMP-binding protein, partial [Candidatus Thermoplasmatota archaeon]|nr:AMP-binding protein [Candidatus Thermoplasmatota archaeon]
MNDFVFTPDHPENTNLMRFARKHGISTIDELYDRADSDTEWFWPAVIEDTDIRFFSPYRSVRDSSRGIPWTTWFTGGTINITYNCVEKRKDSMDPAVKYETEDGKRGSVSFMELDRMTGKLAGFLKHAGISRGDRVGIYMPPSLEGVVALYAIMRVGAVAVPVFSGYGKEAV